MFLIVSNNSEIPIYEQITKQIKDKILSGALSAGEQLPSIRGLAKDLRISVITTKRAYEELEREGYVEMVSGKGCYVTNTNKELIREEILRAIEVNLHEAIELAKKIGFQKEELIDLIEFLYEEVQDE